MPLIAGAFLKNPNSPLINKLIQATQAQITQESYSIHRSPYALLVGGKREQESLQEHVHLFADNQGLLVGRLFDKASHSPCIPNTIDQIKQSQGKALSEHYWGRYILALLDNDTRSVTLFRDPQGLMSLFILEEEDAIFFSSEIALLYNILEIKPELDWSYLVSFVAEAHHSTHRTPFKNITELYQGYGITLSNKGIGTPFSFWDPTKLNYTFTDDRDYEDALLGTLTNCTKAWIKDVPTIGLELSGGIDSSSVLMMLNRSASSDQKIVAFNLYHPAIASSDEREHAKKVADACNIHHLEYVSMEDYASFCMPVTKRFDKPSSFLLNHNFALNMAKKINSYGDIEVLCGQGGDHLFMAPPPMEAVADYFILQGFKGISSHIKELSAYYRMPLLHVLAKNISVFAKYQFNTLNHIELTYKPTPWMTQPFKQMLNQEMFKVPFWQKLKAIPPGKAAHINAVYQASLYIDRGHTTTYRPTINPILSQPLVELGLSSPTFKLYGNGYDRFQFRNAMYRLTSNNYIWRRTKGETSGIVMLSFRNRIKEITKLTLEGQLAQKNLIDRDLLNEHIQNILHGTTEDLWSIINLLGVELWLNSWDFK